MDNRAARVKVHHRPYSFEDGRWCIRLTRLTLVCEVIRYRLVQVRQNQKKSFRIGGPQSPFSISSSFILSFVLLPFFLNTNVNQLTWLRSPPCWMHYHNEADQNNSVTVVQTMPRNSSTQIRTILIQCDRTLRGPHRFSTTAGAD